MNVNRSLDHTSLFCLHFTYILVMRLKSVDGFMKVKKAYVRADHNQDYATLPYNIPEFCPCDEVYNGVTSLAFGYSNYLRRNGNETSISFKSGTKIVKWNSKKMRKIFREKMEQKIYKKCYIKFSG